MSFFSRKPPWEHAKDSCGTEISTNVLPHGNRAWVAVGRAKEIFHDPLLLRINQVLKMVDHEHVDVEYRLYMVGKTETTSKPFVMICCTNKAVGERARDALRASRICSDFPEAGFKFERIRYPLGSVCASQPLAGERSSWDPSGEPEDGHVEGPARDVFSPCSSPAIGRRLFRSRSNGHLVHWATGGVLICIGNDFFQLTTEHIWDDDSADEDTASHDDGESEVWSMDELDENDDFDISQLDHDILSQASITPEPSIMSPSMISLGLSQDTPWEDSSDDGTASQKSNRLFSPRLPSSGCNTPGTSMAAAHDFVQVFPPRLEPLIKTGMVSIQASEGAHPGLDYTAVAIVAPIVSDLVNGVIVPDGPSQRRHLRVRDFAQAGSEETRVFLVAGTNDVKSGVLVPGTIMFKRKDLDAFQEMQLVQIDGIVAEGDCGAVVLDQTHGTFYGYLVRGCPGTGVAYIVPATALFADLSSRGLDARLASSDISNFISYGKPPIAQDKITLTPIDQRLPLSSPLWLSSKGIGHSYLEQQSAVRNDPDPLLYSQSGLEFWSRLLDMNSPRIAREFANFSHGATLEALKDRKDARRNIWLHQWDSAQFGDPFILNASGLYVNNLDVWTMLALSSTCFRHELPALREVMYKHLTSRPYMHVAISRPPLRRSTNLSFLFPAGPDSLGTDIQHYLHEAQVSCSVTGIAENSWTAYCFADTFFVDDCNESEDCIEFYADGEDPTDPLSAGNAMMDRFSLKDPREYFILILRFRIKQVVEEWEHICYRLKQAVMIEGKK
ncbi:hypothetical protein CMUS01_13074 [Colletotrichum musicola]|uniref:Uncharacterized protein n=1 Tax=Colletotrichum musicola TaxID=2175873 RepID=A0A8H6JGZ9_9PEZI|nr:hypothetical protein CMUS01_13074 [Colletotrichum musicola]